MQPFGRLSPSSLVLTASLICAGAGDLRAAEGDPTKPEADRPAAEAPASAGPTEARPAGGAGKADGEAKPTAGQAAERPAPQALKLEPGTTVEIACDTRAVSVADEAKATTGRVRLKLEIPAAAAEGGGRWSVLDVPAAHAASFALLQREACAAAHCPLDSGAPPAINLWAPSKIMPEKLAPGVSMSLGALDLDKATLRVSSFRDNAIAALEQGDCEAVKQP